VNLDHGQGTSSARTPPTPRGKKRGDERSLSEKRRTQGGQQEGANPNDMEALRNASEENCRKRAAKIKKRNEAKKRGRGWGMDTEMDRKRGVKCSQTRRGIQQRLAEGEGG